MTSVRTNIIAGTVATFAVSCILLMKNSLAVFNEVHIPQTISTLLGTDQIVVGGLVFLLFSAFVLSVIYAFVSPYIRVRSALLKGLIFGVGIWLAMMFVFMPLAGAGVFASHRSAVVPAVDLVLALIYGAIISVMSVQSSVEGSNERKRNRTWTSPA